DLAKVSDALFAAGAGNIGPYSQCSFRVSGAGTFFGSGASNPTVGQKGRREEVNEGRLEVGCRVAKVDSVIAALRKAYSYGAPAFDEYPLKGASPFSEGRLGRLAQGQSLGDLVRAVTSALGAGLVQWVGDETRIVERVAIVCGSGGEFWKDAVAARA